MAEGKRLRLSPAMRAFLAVDVVLVLVFVTVLLVTRQGPEDPGPTSAGGATTSEQGATSPGVTGESPGSASPSQDASESPSGEAGEEPDEAQLFASPSRNIMCSITPDAVSCSIAQLSDEGLVEDETCEGTVGHVVRVDAEGTTERPCLEGDPPKKAPRATPQLAYEDSTSAFGFTCTSSRSGVICRHDESGHGFSIARAGSSLF